MPDPSGPPLPPLAAIRAFEAAARHGSFTAAGAELSMTQAAVSYQIRILEERVGAPLFRRRARGVALTAEGQRLAEPAGEAMAILREAFAEARRDAGETLVISVLATFATHVLAPGLGRFQIAHPAITTRVEIDHRMADLLAGEATVAIRAGQGVWPGLRADHLMRATYTPMVSRAFVERHGPLRSPEDLLSVPRLDADDPDWALWFRAAGVMPPPATGRTHPALRHRGGGHALHLARLSRAAAQRARHPRLPELAPGRNARPWRAARGRAGRRRQIFIFLKMGSGIWRMMSMM